MYHVCNYLKINIHPKKPCTVFIILFDCTANRASNKSSIIPFVQFSNQYDIPQPDAMSVSMVPKSRPLRFTKTQKDAALVVTDLKPRLLQ